MATVLGAGAAKRAGRGEGAPRAKDGRNAASGRTMAKARDSARAFPPAAVDALISEHIIPRLLMAQSHGPVPRIAAQGTAKVDAAEAARFASLPLQLEADELLALVESILARGACVESVFVDLLAPSARRLGKHWEDDDCDFVDVTMGLWRLQEVMREVTMRYPPPRAVPFRTRSALFAPMPGDPHSFGALMVEEVFARAGWQTEVLIDPERKELLQNIADHSVDLVGLTISCDCPNAKLASLISAMRSVSRSPDLKILIGGRMVNANPALVDEVGADGSAQDACGALDLAERLVPMQALPARFGA
ncbi:MULTISPECIES: B12-binding domain-containing protein [unclassified Novosphingobium]|uniref:cobalamin B12-binding domain-containing protein n=1 Tax=unclassified Novosphingobium TaxID=2644732 RepID=UPI000D3217E2|nr:MULTISPECIES: cobalamin B12-binding domain-containing protein [unclassified Novosphingobium]PTR13194.1 methanogenic corrinoid protein MtbC1 [Novosphingobium sp. GV055]PUB07413.1 methanogenic corrinoid protein MtbC1 [Novosphingobium sp. GV061]PUB23226.1 methanogenic corrinoid protein MtbC1 [Novosphingobium sp. GV079]PUB44990.1 methanogenic corrinoid protein MtbC1 [Novosphingobium sp. GV027]